MENTQIMHDWNACQGTVMHTPCTLKVKQMIRFFLIVRLIYKHFMGKNYRKIELRTFNAYTYIMQQAPQRILEVDKKAYRMRTSYLPSPTARETDMNPLNTQFPSRPKVMSLC